MVSSRDQAGRKQSPAYMLEKPGRKLRHTSGQELFQRTLHYYSLVHESLHFCTCRYICKTEDLFQLKEPIGDH